MSKVATCKEYGCYKLAVIEFAKLYSNREAERKYKLPISMIENWRKAEDTIRFLSHGWPKVEKLQCEYCLKHCKERRSLKRHIQVPKQKTKNILTFSGKRKLLY